MEMMSQIHRIPPVGSEVAESLSWSLIQPRAGVPDLWLQAICRKQTRHVPISEYAILSISGTIRTLKSSIYQNLEAFSANPRLTGELTSMRV